MIKKNLIKGEILIMEAFLTVEEVQQYKRMHRKAKRKREADKIKTILLLNDGFSYEQIAKILLLDDQTIRRYQNIYVAQGVEGLTQDHYQGSESKLNKEQQRKLMEHLDTTIYLKAQNIAEYVKTTFGIQYTEKGILYLLHRLGFVYKKPKKIPGKADAEKQKVFIEQTYDKLKSSMGPNDRLYFVDGVHPQHNPIAAYGWIRKGTLKEIKTNTGRKRININGALDIETFNLVYREDPTINADSTIGLLQQLELQNPLSNHIYVICDNARYYRSRLVQDYIKDSKIELIFLPSYSPNLNLIEHLWRFLNKHLRYNRYHETFDLFKEACFEILDNLQDYHEELTSLLTERFEITGQTFSQT